MEVSGGSSPTPQDTSNSWDLLHLRLWLFLSTPWASLCLHCGSDLSPVYTGQLSQTWGEHGICFLPSWVPSPSQPSRGSGRLCSLFPPLTGPHLPVQAIVLMWAGPAEPPVRLELRGARPPPCESLKTERRVCLAGRVHMCRSMWTDTRFYIHMCLGCAFISVLKKHGACVLYIHMFAPQHESVHVCSHMFYARTCFVGNRC